MKKINVCGFLWYDVWFYSLPLNINQTSTRKINVDSIVESFKNSTTRMSIIIANYMYTDLKFNISTVLFFEHFSSTTKL